MKLCILTIKIRLLMGMKKVLRVLCICCIYILIIYIWSIYILYGFYRIGGYPNDYIVVGNYL